MPYFDFSKANRVKAVLKKEQKKRAVELLKIAPTCFKLPDIIEHVEPLTEFLREVKRIAKGRIFYTRNQNFFVNNKIILSSLAGWLVDYICYTIEFDSNIVKLNVDDIGLLINKKKSVIYEAIQELDDNNIIKKTDINQTYVINHNVIFKGDLVEFLYNYYELYGKGKAPLGDKLFDDIDYINGKIKNRKELKIKHIIYGKSESAD